MHCVYTSVKHYSLAIGFNLCPWVKIVNIEFCCHGQSLDIVRSLIRRFT